MTDTGNMDRVSKEINDAFTGFVSSGLGTIDEGYNDLKNDPKVKNPGLS